MKKGGLGEKKSPVHIGTGSVNSFLDHTANSMAIGPSIFYHVTPVHVALITLLDLLTMLWPLFNHAILDLFFTMKPKKSVADVKQRTSKSSGNDSSGNVL